MKTQALLYRKKINYMLSSEQYTLGMSCLNQPWCRDYRLFVEYIQKSQYSLHEQYTLLLHQMLPSKQYTAAALLLQDHPQLLKKVSHTLTTLSTSIITHILLTTYCQLCCWQPHQAYLPLMMQTLRHLQQKQQLPETDLLGMAAHALLIRKNTLFIPLTAHLPDLNKYIPHGLDNHYFTYNNVYSQGHTLLTMSVIGGNRTLTDHLLKQPHINVNVPTSDGHSCLMLAAQQNATRLFKRLLNQGANLDMTDVHGYNAVAHAVLHFSPSILLHVKKLHLYCTHFRDKKKHGLFTLFMHASTQALLARYNAYAWSQNRFSHYNKQRVNQTLIVLLRHSDHTACLTWCPPKKKIEKWCAMGQEMRAYLPWSYYLPNPTSALSVILTAIRRLILKNNANTPPEKWQIPMHHLGMMRTFWYLYTRFPLLVKKTLHPILTFCHQWRFRIHGICRHDMTQDKDKNKNHPLLVQPAGIIGLIYSYQPDFDDRRHLDCPLLCKKINTTKQQGNLTLFEKNHWISLAPQVNTNALPWHEQDHARSSPFSSSS